MINKYELILLAAGKGERMCLPLNKIFYKFKKTGKMVIEHSLDVFLNDERCSKIVIVYNENDRNIVDELVKKYKSNKIDICAGGITRQDSILNGLKLINSDYVLVHDSARPNVKKELIDDILLNLGIFDCCSCGVKVSDTIKKESNGKLETVDRESLYYVQTPQGSDVKKLTEALGAVKRDKVIVTDDLQAFEYICNNNVKITKGDKNNIKVTTKDDLVLLEYLLVN